MKLGKVEFSPNQSRILKLMGDGGEVSTQDLIAELDCTRNTIKTHIHVIRKKLNRVNPVVKILQEKNTYRLVKVEALSLGDIRALI